MEGFSTLSLIVFISILTPNGCLGIIGCFMCSSRNGSNIDCEDPFNATTTSYVEKCKVPKRHRGGEFPAHFCLKVIGESYDTGEKVTIRRCVLDNIDTQCGDFRMEDEKLKGCILTCATDGCNSANCKFSSVFPLLGGLLYAIPYF